MTEPLKAEMRDKKNIYTCKICGKYIVTIDMDEGVTPMFLNCRATRDCHGTMVSHMYRVPQNIDPDWEWHKPIDLSGLSPDMREHVELGGLCIRRKS